MRGFLAAVLCLAPGIAFAQMLPGAELGGPAPSLTRSGGTSIAAGKIGAVDSVGMSFVCGADGQRRTYWVTRTTRFTAGGAAASFYDLQTGERAQVVFHRSGGRAIADAVRLGT